MRNVTAPPVFALAALTRILNVSPVHPLRIVIDGTMARGGGGYTFLANLPRHLIEQEPKHRYLLLLSSEQLANRIPKLPQLETQLFSPSLPRRLAFLTRDAGQFARSFRADVYFCAGEILPWGLSCPAISSMRNPNVFEKRGQWPLAQRLRLTLLHRLSVSSARRSANVVFVSRDSARWMGDALGLPSRKRVAILHGVDRARFGTSDEANRGAARSVLSVSSVYRYKNFVPLIHAFGALSRRRTVPELVIIGENLDPPYFESMRRAAAQYEDAKIRILGKREYEKIEHAYRDAEAFVLLSRLETFGHPVAEALAAGLPILLADTPVFREVAADAAVFVDPTKLNRVVEALETVVFDEAKRVALRRAARARSLELSWDAAASHYLALFASTANTDPSAT